MSTDVIATLAATIKSRRDGSAAPSYTKQLLDAGAERCARKFGEEAIEVVIAGVGQTREALTAEAADVIYHLLVLLEARDITWSEVTATLEKRMGMSGLQEKASRGG